VAAATATTVKHTGHYSGHYNGRYGHYKPRKASYKKPAATEKEGMGEMETQDEPKWEGEGGEMTAASGKDRGNLTWGDRGGARI